MNATTILVKKNARGKIQFLRLMLRDAFIYREWGVIGGKTQTTQNEYGFVNEGKANQMAPVDTAQADYNRLVTLKIKEGMIQVDDLNNLPDLDTVPAIDLANIPTALCCSKPIQKISKAALSKLIKSGNSKSFIKYNGLCHYIVIQPDKDIRIYTRRWIDHTVKYPEIVQDVQERNYPPGTMLISEFTINPTLMLPHMTAFQLMSGISKTDTVKGICADDQTETYKLQKAHRVRAAIFGILYWDSQAFWQNPYQAQLELLNEKVPSITQNNSIFRPSEVPIPSATHALKSIRRLRSKIEGLVIWDITQSMQMTLNGKPKRTAAWKLKPKDEMDVIAYEGVPGTGRNSHRFGSLRIGRYDEQGRLIDMGSAGNLPVAMQDPNIWIFPTVIAVEYDNIFPDTGKLQHGHYLKVHEDKIPADVELFSFAA